ncbi:hypothetical protein KVR01_010002 [Diaporthe batatas]|uniref:uncharacterized protein n=1 Tax=Diaporthe batatas TaxID=748121 RepID=UPI001D041D38|nr:uncharacterized protein KVR01_010002 [Diaporthe batatas]KAG8160466.1 hypothetical protein KVR01_010002 [Diaporthe batatas]
MSTNKKWDDASQKDLLFAMLMSTGDGSGTIKPDWKEVEKMMNGWGYTFTIGAMSQHWSKTILKAFKERHPDNSGDGGNTNAGPTIAKTPASSKAKAKTRKRPASDEDAPLEKAGKGKASHGTAKKRKVCQDNDEEEDGDEHVIKGKAETDDGHNSVA